MPSELLRAESCVFKFIVPSDQKSKNPKMFNLLFNNVTKRSSKSSHLRIWKIMWKQLLKPIDPPIVSVQHTVYIKEKEVKFIMTARVWRMLQQWCHSSSILQTSVTWHIHANTVLVDYFLWLLQTIVPWKVLTHSFVTQTRPAGSYFFLSAVR